MPFALLRNVTCIKVAQSRLCGLCQQEAARKAEEKRGMDVESLDNRTRVSARARLLVADVKETSRRTVFAAPVKTVDCRPIGDQTNATCFAVSFDEMNLASG